MLGAYNATQSPVWRTTALAGGGSCSCGQPGAPGTPSGISARWLDVHSPLTDSPSWRNSFPQYYHPRTVLPLGATAGIDLRHVYPFPVIYGADSGLSLSQAADSGLYRVSWSGDGTSLLVAFQMPTARDGTEWDFSDRGGRITPDLAELEDNWHSPRYGDYLQFAWSSVLKANGVTDHIGSLHPLTLAGLSETPVCAGFGGRVVSYLEPYGDVTPDYFNATADTYGYLRQYDFGSCSSFLPLRGFVRSGLLAASDEQTLPGSFPTGDIHIHTTKVHFLMASVLRDQAGKDPVLRLPGADELQVDLVASGHADTTVVGDHVSCPFTAKWKARLSVDVHAERPYYNRIQLHMSDISAPSIDLGECSGYAAFNTIVDAILTGITASYESYQNIAQGKVDAQTGTVKARLVGRLVADVNSANEALAPPLPDRALLIGDPLGLLAASAGFPAYRQELQTQRATSTLLLSSAPGPAGSCLSPVNPRCAPCYDLLDPGRAVVNPADIKACLNAPAECRVPVGGVNPYSCDARDLSVLFKQQLIRIPTPYRCRLALPISRMDLQPDGYRLVLSDGFHCRSGYQRVLVAVAVHVAEHHAGEGVDCGVVLPPPDPRTRAGLPRHG